MGLQLGSRKEVTEKGHSRRQDWLVLLPAQSEFAHRLSLSVETVGKRALDRELGGPHLIWLCLAVG